MNDRPLDPRRVVERLAGALDADDFTTLASLLAPGCRYTIAGGTHDGPAAIVASYQQGSAKARELFDSVAFSHHVARTGDSTFRVDFMDDLTYAGETLTHHSIQDLTVGADGSVTDILDVTSDDERVRIEAFLRRHGLER